VRSSGFFWILVFFSLVAFPLAAVATVRSVASAGVLLLLLVWAAWTGNLIAYGAWLGGPQMSLVMIGLPLSGAAIASYRARAEAPNVARRRAIVTCIALFVPGFIGGLWWGVESCQGGCL
jgi:hypothetical protein